jgi:hypothetical protein
MSYLEIIIIGYKDQKEGWRPPKIKQLNPCSFETGSCCAAQAGLELAILLLRFRGTDIRQSFSGEAYKRCVFNPSGHKVEFVSWRGSDRWGD